MQSRARAYSIPISAVFPLRCAPGSGAGQTAHIMPPCRGTMPGCVSQPFFPQSAAGSFLQRESQKLPVRSGHVQALVPAGFGLCAHGACAPFQAYDTAVPVRRRRWAGCRCLQMKAPAVPRSALPDVILFCTQACAGVSPDPMHPSPHARASIMAAQALLTIFLRKMDPWHSMHRTVSGQAMRAARSPPQKHLSFRSFLHRSILPQR